MVLAVTLQAQVPNTAVTSTVVMNFCVDPPEYKDEGGCKGKVAYSGAYSFKLNIGSEKGILLVKNPELALERAYLIELDKCIVWDKSNWDCNSPDNWYRMIKGKFYRNVSVPGGNSAYYAGKYDEYNSFVVQVIQYFY